MKPISKKVSTFIRDSDHLIRKLHKLGETQSNDFLFTEDAVAMHPNIDTEEGIVAILLPFELNIINTMQRTLLYHNFLEL